MTKHRIVIAVAALVGAALGAVLGLFAVPHTSRYTASANIAMLPAADLTTVEASNFWEVLTRGQVSRTAAVVYADPRWLPSAANAAKVQQSELTLDAAALPETTVLTVTVTADSSSAAEAAINGVLTTATPEVTSLVAPYAVKVMWPPKGSATPVPAPSRAQLAAAGTLGGLLVGGGGVGWFVTRRRSRSSSVDEHWSDSVNDEVQPTQ